MTAQSTLIPIPETGPAKSAAGPRPVPAAAPPDWISHTLRHLERWVAWSIAVYTAWLAVFAFPQVPAIWAFVLYAGLVGKWAEARPARNQSEMSWRGVALIAGAYMLHTHTAPEVGGPIGPFFFWLSITCLYYALMLKPSWGATIVAFAVFELTVSFIQTPGLSSPAEYMVHAGFLLIFPMFLAMRVGIGMRAPDEQLENGRIDGSTSLYNKAGFVAHGDALLAACRRDRRPLAVAVFDCADLLEVREIYGTRIARKLMSRIADKLTVLSGDRGVAARTGPAQFAVVLPGTARDKAVAAIAKVMGNPMRIELDAGDDEIVLVPRFLVEVAGPDITQVGELHAELERELALMDHQEKRRQNYLQRERERHSRPMGLHAAADSLPSMPADMADAARASASLASTVPAPPVLH